MVAAPTDPDDAIVCIQSSGVTIDFGGHTLSMDPTTTAANFSGITIGSGLSNIIIKNCFIENLTGTGILIGDGCSNITIDNVQILNAQLNSIFINGLPNNLAQEIIIKNCFLSGSIGSLLLPAYGLRALYVTGLHLINNRFKNINNGFLLDGFGISIEQKSNFKLESLFLDNNHGYTNAYCIRLLQSKSGIIEDCQVDTTCTSTNSLLGNAYGILLDQTTNTILKNNSVTNTSGVERKQMALKQSTALLI